MTLIQRAEPEESHVQEVLRFALDDETDIINVTLNLFQGLIAVKTRHFDKMLKQVQHDNFSCAEHTEKNLFTYSLIYLFTYSLLTFHNFAPLSLERGIMFLNILFFGIIRLWKNLYIKFLKHFLKSAPYF